MLEIDRRLIAVTPSERQIALQEMEFYAFIHFTVKPSPEESGVTARNPRKFSTPRSSTPINGSPPSKRQA